MERQRALATLTKGGYLRKKKYSKKGVRKTRKSRKIRGGFRRIRDDLLDELCVYMAEEIRKPRFSPVPKDEDMFSREVRLLAATRINALPNDVEFNRRKTIVVRYLLAEQQNQVRIDNPHKLVKYLIKLGDVYDKEQEIRMSHGRSPYSFVLEFPDKKIKELILQVSDKLVAIGEYSLD
jgi:hypothetical protein